MALGLWGGVCGNGLPLIGVEQPSATTTTIVVIPLLKSLSFSPFFGGGGLPSPITKNSLAASHECQDHCAFHGTYALRASPLCHFWAPQNIGKWSFVFLKPTQSSSRRLLRALRVS
jgi:hypothetical protein